MGRITCQAENLLASLEGLCCRTEGCSNGGQTPSVCVASSCVTVVSFLKCSLVCGLPILGTAKKIENLRNKRVINF
jgi:hypothetical protein